MTVLYACRQRRHPPSRNQLKRLNFLHELAREAACEGRRPGLREIPVFLMNVEAVDKAKAY